MYKKVIYNDTHEAIFVDGKFSSLILNFMMDSATSPIYVQHMKVIYFIHDGVLYKVHRMRDLFSFDEIRMYQKGLMKEVLDDKSIAYIPWHDLRTAFRDMIKRPQRTNIQLHFDNAVLIDIPEHDMIEGQYYENGNTYELLTYNRSTFTYGLCSETMFEGYPDLNDSSTCMNLMLTGANVNRLKVLIDMFEEYTKHKKLPRGQYINVQLQA